MLRFQANLGLKNLLKKIYPKISRTEDKRNKINAIEEEEEEVQIKSKYHCN